TLRLFFINHTATTVFYPLSLHDALPILFPAQMKSAAADLLGQDRSFHGKDGEGVGHNDRNEQRKQCVEVARQFQDEDDGREDQRSEEHTSELQSLRHLVCRLLLEKKKKK